MHWMECTTFYLSAKLWSKIIYHFKWEKNLLVFFFVCINPKCNPNHYVCSSEETIKYLLLVSVFFTYLFILFDFSIVRFTFTKVCLFFFFSILWVLNLLLLEIQIVFFTQLQFERNDFITQFTLPLIPLFKLCKL